MKILVRSITAVCYFVCIFYLLVRQIKVSFVTARKLSIISHDLLQQMEFSWLKKQLKFPEHLQVRDNVQWAANYSKINPNRLMHEVYSHLLPLCSLIQLIIDYLQKKNQ